MALEASQSADNTIRSGNLVQYVYTLKTGMRVIEYLCQFFTSVELYEQCSDFFKMRISKDDKTIGFIFGTVQESKEKLNISEYSVSQTSLEQIFQSFANQTSKHVQKAFKFTLAPDGHL